MNDANHRTEIRLDDLLPPAKNLLAQIAQSSVCADGKPVSVIQDNGEGVSKAIVSFSIDTGVLSSDAELPIETIEPTTLIYNSIEEIGMQAPVKLIFIRDEFPDPNYHVYSRKIHNGYGIEPCLSGLPLPEFFEAVGVNGLINKAREWLNDAKTGNLLKDGWEPLPVTDNNYSMVDIDRIQNSFISSDKLFYLTAARSSGNAVWFLPEFQYPSDTPVKNSSSWIRDIRQTLDPKFICTIHINLTLEGHSNKPFISNHTKLTDLETELDKINPGAFSKVRQWVEESDLDEISRNENERQVILVVGIKRPIPLIGSAHISNKNDDAACYEIAAFRIKAPTEQRNFYKDARVERITIFPLPNKALFNYVSGQCAPEHVCIIGCGALGSQIANAYARKGTGTFTFFDPDDLLVHNIARHTGSLTHIGTKKVEIIEEQIKSLYPSGELRINSFSRKFNPANTDDLKIVQEADIIFDCTANELMRRQLSGFRNEIENPLVRLEMYDHGRIGAISVQLDAETGMPDLYDLGLLFISEAGSKNGAVRDWLKRERAGHTPNEEMTVGLGCSSFTTRLPGHLVTNQASTLIAATTKACSDNETLGYQVLSDDFLPNEKFNWVNELKVSIIEFSEIGWSVHISEQVLKQIRELRAQHSENETGGYLYGAYNYELKRITIIYASYAPNPDNSGATHFELPPVKKDLQGSAFLRRTNFRFASIGAWHSHPSGSAMPSRQDLTTKSNYVLADFDKGLPSAMIIIAENEFSVAFGLEKEIILDVFPLESV